MSTPKTKWFQEFLSGVREPLTWANLEEYGGIGALRFLKGDELSEAEDILFERLRDNDGRAAYALADVKSQRAIPELRARLGADVPADMRLAAARALHQLGDDVGRAAAIDVLAHASNDNTRLSAVSTVGDLGGEGAEAALEAALNDSDSTVRSTAGAVLMQLHGLQEYNQSYQDRLGLLQNRLSSPLRAVRADALVELHDVFARTKAGDTAEALGLAWRADDANEPLHTLVLSFQSNQAPYQEDFPTDVMAALVGQERTWAEDSLWHFLPTDPRAARALSKLGIKRGIEPLREVLATATGAVAIEAAAALWRLAGDDEAHQRVVAATHDPDPALAERARAALGEPA